jgi:hypothetical protein
VKRFTNSNLRPTSRPACRGLSSHASRIAHHAFSLVEILVTIGLLSFIILGLLAMFNQTQRAFRSSITQNDVLEGGRATMDLIGRDLVQMRPSEGPNYFQNGVWRQVTNFYAGISPQFLTPLVQELPGNTAPRTNMVQSFFFLSKANLDWFGTGYFVLADAPGSGVGTLYRFAMVNPSRYGSVTVVSNFITTSPGTYTRVADGIVHLRARAFAIDGSLITTNPITGTNGYSLTPAPPYHRVDHTVACVNAYDPSQSDCFFMSNAVPAYVEVELGMLEQRTLQHYRAIGNSTPALVAQQLQYLSNHCAQVHLFRQRFSIINVDPAAYR